MGMTNEHVSADRIRGILWGLVCGDALGSPLEFKSRRQLAERYPDGVTGMVAGWGNTAGRAAGEITDDSEMAIALLGSLLAAKGYDRKLTRAAYLRWLRSDPADCGITIAQALGWNEYNGESEANGALMRIAPVAIASVLYDFDWEMACIEDARQTHINVKCAVANIAYVAALRALLAGKSPEAAWAAALDKVCKLPSPALEARLLAAREAEPRYTPQGGWVEIAFQSAFYWLLHAESYEQALLHIVHQLGDPDTNGAIAGAMLGARFGESAIPAAWKQAVLDARTEDRPAKFGVRHALHLLDAAL